MESRFSVENLKLKNRYFLAPMHQINDIAFRILCKKAGAGMVYTELLSPQSKAFVDFSDKPAIQLICNQTKGLRKFIKKHERNAMLFDLNLGCPSAHAKESKSGYFMSDNYSLIEEILKEMRSSTKLPITIKIRKMNWFRTRKVIKIAEKYCDAIGVHPRTQKQGYAGVADVKYAMTVKKLTKLPVIYSGDIDSKEKADKLLDIFDFVMVGRKAIGNPNIFYELTGTREPGKYLLFNDYLKLAKKYKIDFSQIKGQAMKFTKGLRNSSKMREKLVYAKTLKEISEIVIE